MLRIPVRTPSRSYPVLLESGLVARAGQHLRRILKHRKVFVVTVPPVGRRWGKVLLHSLEKAGLPASTLEMPDGEPFKRLATLEKLAGGLVRLGADRNATLVALGGGVVCDVTGFLASVYMRGVEVIHIPTTVLAQVDAAIGGKTGVNLESGKNLLGTFHQPRAVLVDPGVLVTLPSREFRAGLYESIKSGLIGNPGLFRLFESRRREILDRDPAVLERVIAESVRLKARVVSADEREGGLRQVLNLGHTIGHALEAETRFTQLLHGEAVAWGMIAATHIAHSTGRLDDDSAERITRATLALGKLPAFRAQTAGIMKRLHADKKTRDGVVHFILNTKIGKVVIANDVPSAVVRSAVEEIRRMARA